MHLNNTQRSIHVTCYTFTTASIRFILEQTMKAHRVERYRSTRSLTSALAGGLVGQRHAPAALPP